MKTSGEILKAKRDQLRLELEQVSKKLKIQRIYLEALESNNYQTFDSKVIARGFLVKYANFLDLDTEKVLAFWRRDFSIGRIDIGPKETVRKNFTLSPKTMGGLVLVTIFTIFIVFGYVQYQKLRKPPLLSVNSPKDGISIDMDRVSLEGKASWDSELFLNDKKISIDSDGKFLENLYLSPGINKFTLKALNSLGIESVKTITVYNSKDDTEYEKTNTENKNILKVTSNSKNPVFIEIKDGQETLFTGFILEKVRQEFKGNHITFYTDSIENVILEYNNKKVDKEGKEFGVFYKEL